MSVIGVDEVKDRLNKGLSVDDGELADMIDAAEAEYEQLIGPVEGTVVEKHHGGGTSLILRNAAATAITAAAYSDGTAIDLDDLDLDTATGILHWAYDTAGRFTYGTRNVTVTYTVALPANHREAIIADVAGYFAATQRGGPAGRPDFDAPTDDFGGFTPTTLFPRIRELASRMPSIA